MDAWKGDLGGDETKKGENTYITTNRMEYQLTESVGKLLFLQYQFTAHFLQSRALSHQDLADLR